jgi:uncharacterized protein YkwD
MTFLSPEKPAALGRSSRPLLASLALAWAACAPSPDDDVVARTSALGEPNGDYPSYDERVALYATNRARVSPATEGWPSYPAQPPMQWNYDLNRSSRAHSVDMRDTPCFQHPSCDGTDTFKRVFMFYTGPWSSVAENISAGTVDPQAVVAGWISEKGAAPGETGHRDAIFSAKLDLIGVGFAPGGASRTPNYWTQDFVETKLTRPRLTDGIHFPKSAAAGGKVTFGATYYDAAAGATTPQVFVAVDGACTGLARVRGTASLGAHEGAVTLADGCHAYYFVATSGDGVALATYPTTGSLQVGAGSAAATCALFTTARAAATCAGMAGGTGGSSGGGGSGAGGAPGGAGSPGGVAGAPGGAGSPGGVAGAPGGAGSPGGGAGATGTAGANGGGGRPVGAAGTTGGAAGQSGGGTSGTPGTTGGGAGAPGGTAGGTGHDDPGAVSGAGCAVAPRDDASVVALAGVALLIARRRRSRSRDR